MNASLCSRHFPASMAKVTADMKILKHVMSRIKTVNAFYCFPLYTKYKFNCTSLDNIINAVL